MLTLSLWMSPDAPMDQNFRPQSKKKKKKKKRLFLCLAAKMQRLKYLVSVLCKGIKNKPNLTLI